MIANLLAWASQSLILVAIAALMPSLFRTHSARAQLTLLQTVLLAMLALPMLQPWKHPVDLAPVLVTDSSSVVPMRQRNVAQPPAPIDWEKIALCTLVAGMLARGARFAIGLLRLRAYRLHAQPLDLNTEIPVALSTDITSPVTFGIVRPVVLVPPMFLDMPEDQKSAVLTHEFLHVKRRDWLFCLAEELAFTLMWFHPAVWFLVRRIRTLREQVVDAAAVALTQDREPYVEALLAIAQARPMLDVAAAPLFLRRTDLTDRVEKILEDSSMSVRRVVFSYAFVTVILVTAGVYSVSTFPLIGAPMQNELDVRGVLTRIDLSRLPQPLQSQVEARVSAHRNAPFTTDLMLRMKADVAQIDPKIQQNWVEEAPKQYSVWFAYETDVKVAKLRLVRIDASRLPEALRAQVQARVNSFLNAEFKEDVMQGIQSAVTPVDRKIAYKWSNEPGGNVSLTLLYEAPEQSWQFVNGVLARIDVSSLPEPDRSLMEQRLAKYVNAPYTNALMQEISIKTSEVSRQWALKWNTDSPGVFSLTIAPPAAFGLNLQSQLQQPDFPSDGEKQIRVGGGVQASKAKATPPPAYPPLARQARIQGVVRFHLQIGKDGKVKNVRLISGHPLLVPAAVEALARYEYEPTLLNGEPVQVVTTADIEFRLDN